MRSPLAQRNPSLVVIDKVPCISDWGHDLRPDYCCVGRLVQTLPNVRLLATIATASNRVRADLQRERGIIYALTTRDAALVAEWLQSCGINARD